jgi:hypothetical protein
MKTPVNLYRKKDRIETLAEITYPDGSVWQVRVHHRRHDVPESWKIVPWGVNVWIRRKKGE